MLHTYNFAAQNARRIFFVTCVATHMLGCSDNYPGDDVSTADVNGSTKEPATPGLTNTQWRAVSVDGTATTYHQFSCDEQGLVEFRFVGPETIELLLGSDRQVLQRQKAASGARYASDYIEFWNRGNEAMLVVGDQRYQCVLSKD